MTEASNPTAGGCYVRDPVTGELMTEAEAAEAAQATPKPASAPAPTPKPAKD